MVLIICGGVWLIALMMCLIYDKINLIIKKQVEEGLEAGAKTAQEGGSTLADIETQLKDVQTKLEEIETKLEEGVEAEVNTHSAARYRGSILVDIKSLLENIEANTNRIEE
jgi:phage shock protein A